MTIEVEKVKQFGSKPVNVIMVDGKPICTCRGAKNTSNIIAKLQGYNVKLSDQKIEKMIEKKLGLNEQIQRSK